MTKRYLWMLALLCGPVLAADDAPVVQTVPVLAAVPGCTEAKFGRVSISLGSKDARGKRGVSYQQAFDKLAQAAVKKGGNAVVLRSHEAAYITRSKKTDPRPGYIALEGLVVRTASDTDRCALDVIDPEEYAQRSRDAERVDVTTENRAF